MFAILAEDDSDAEVLMHIIKRFLSNDRLSVKKKGYDGCGQLYRKGARDINSWLERDIKYFIVCIDADSADPILVYRNI